MGLKLTGKQKGELQRVLLSAFPKRNPLEQMVEIHLDVLLDQVARGGGTLKDDVWDLIKWADAEGVIEDLLVAGRTENSGNPDLLVFVTEIGLLSDDAPQAGGKLEAMIVKGLPFADVAQFRSKMRDIEAATCMLEDANGVGWGTGFLVGPDLIMTNQHVVLELRKHTGTPQVRFGYIKNEGSPGVGDGVVVKMVDKDWEAFSSPSDLLDFALLKLAEDASTMAVDGKPRGFLTPKGDHTFINDEPIMIIQHPQREPMKLGVGYLKDTNSQTKRIAYTTNTEPGSSGSPCLTLGWELIAIHHHGEQFSNHGIPMKPILAHLKEQGLMGLLGQGAETQSSVEPEIVQEHGPKIFSAVDKEKAPVEGLPQIEAPVPITFHQEYIDKLKADIRKWVTQNKILTTRLKEVVGSAAEADQAIEEALFAMDVCEFFTAIDKAHMLCLESEDGDPVSSQALEAADLIERLVDRLTPVLAQNFNPFPPGDSKPIELQDYDWLMGTGGLNASAEIAMARYDGRAVSMTQTGAEGGLIGTDSVPLPPSTGIDDMGSLEKRDWVDMMLMMSPRTYLEALADDDKKLDLINDGLAYIANRNGRSPYLVLKESDLCDPGKAEASSKLLKLINGKLSAIKIITLCDSSLKDELNVIRGLLELYIRRFGRT